MFQVLHFDRYIHTKKHIKFHNFGLIISNEVHNFERKLDDPYKTDVRCKLKLLKLP